MILNSLLWVIVIVTAIYAVANTSALISCGELMEEAFKTGNIPNSNLVKKSEKVTANVIYLAAIIIVLITLIKLRT